MNKQAKSRTWFPIVHSIGDMIQVAQVEGCGERSGHHQRQDMIPKKQEDMSHVGSHLSTGSVLMLPW